MKKIYDGFAKCVNTLNYAGLFALFFIMVTTTIDVFLRKTGTGLSVKGSYELTEMGMVVVVYLAIPMAHLTDGHIRIDMLVSKIPLRIRRFFESFITLAESVFVFMMAAGAYQKCRSLVTVGTTTSVLKIPQLPFAMVMCAGLWIFAVLLAMNTILLFMDGLQYRESAE